MKSALCLTYRGCSFNEDGSDFVSLDTQFSVCVRGAFPRCDSLFNVGGKNELSGAPGDAPKEVCRGEESEGE
jgi:hypothetical protein